jgi:hypothetical protein
MNLIPKRVSEIAKEKVHIILSEHPGYVQICEIEEILAGKRTEL